MTDKRFIRPARPALVVRFPFPSTEVLPAAGRIVTYSAWWSAKKREGDIVVEAIEPQQGGSNDPEKTPERTKPQAEPKAKKQNPSPKKEA